MELTDVADGVHCIQIDSFGCSIVSDTVKLAHNTSTHYFENINGLMYEITFYNSICHHYSTTLNV